MSMERMMKARTGLVTTYPFFGVLAYNIELVEDAKVKSTVINGRSLRFNPEWVDARPMPELEAAFAHQVFSCALGHHLRRGGRNAKRWNEASDYAINLELKKEGFQLPDGALFDQAFAGMHVEAIYAARERQESEGGSGEGQGQGDPSGSPSGDPGHQASGEDGQGADATGSVDDAEGDDGGPADDAEIAEQLADWQQATATATQVAKAAGRMPGSMERMVDHFLNSKVGWREALQRVIVEKAKDDYSWSKPNRRYLHQGLILPSLDSVKMGALAFAIDMSGSIGQNDIVQFCSEIEEARSAVRPERIIAMAFDTQVRRTYEFGDDDPIRVQVMAGGGTAFDDPVAELDRLGIEPACLIYLTDLDSSVFPQEPNYPVIWVSTGKSRAPFGEVIMMQ